MTLSDQIELIGLIVTGVNALAMIILTIFLVLSNNRMVKFSDEANRINNNLIEQNEFYKEMEKRRNQKTVDNIKKYHVFVLDHTIGFCDSVIKPIALLKLSERLSDKHIYRLAKRWMGIEIKDRSKILNYALLFKEKDTMVFESYPQKIIGTLDEIMQSPDIYTLKARKIAFNLRSAFDMLLMEVENRDGFKGNKVVKSYDELTDFKRRLQELKKEIENTM